MCVHLVCFEYTVPTWCPCSLDSLNHRKAHQRHKHISYIYIYIYSHKMDVDCSITFSSVPMGSRIWTLPAKQVERIIETHGCQSDRIEAQQAFFQPH